MPAAEAQGAVDERNSYEFAFHVLPTVAEGEVPGVFDAIKALITKAKGEVFDEEAPERFDLSYEIVKHLEGKNRKFSSAYFGWVRFKVESDAIESILEGVDSNNQILRHLLIKLTKEEEANPFKFHEALASQKMVTTVEESKVIPDLTTVDHSEDGVAIDEEEEGEVDELALEEALVKDEA